MNAMSFSYRAVMVNGSVGAGRLDAADEAAALASLRRMGARPISLEPAVAPQAGGQINAGPKARKAAVALAGDLAALLGAGLPIDRALGLAIANVEDKTVGTRLADILVEVREGVPLSVAMARQPGLFSPVSSAMAEAGEANGMQAQALGRLAQMLESAEDLRRTVTTAMIYPAILTVIAVVVILMMLLFVVPQFESLFDQARGELPPASAFVMAASRFVRNWGWVLLGGFVALGFGLRQLMAAPSARKALDRALLSVPQLGQLVRYIETARFARTLGSLLEGDVPLVKALVLARRTVSNAVIGEAIETVADGVREGGGMAGPLAASGALPRLATAFLRTGEETSQLGPMLLRLADVLDRDIKTMLQRVIGFLTPPSPSSWGHRLPRSSPRSCQRSSASTIWRSHHDHDSHGPFALPNTASPCSNCWSCWRSSAC